MGWMKKLLKFSLSGGLVCVVVGSVIDLVRVSRESSFMWVFIKFGIVIGLCVRVVMR